MNRKSIASLVPLCCLFFLGEVVADDAPMDEAFGEAPVPSAVEISPADSEYLIGVNRLAAAYERFWRLADAIQDQDDTPDIRKFFLFRDLGRGVLNFDGPLSIFSMEPEPRSFAYGARWLVQDRVTAAQSLQAAAGLEDREEFRGHTRMPFIGTMPAAFDGMVLTIGDAYSNQIRRSPIDRILASAPLTESLTEAECAALAEADAFAVIDGETSYVKEFWNQSLAPPRAESSESRTEEQQVQHEIWQLTQDVEWLTLGISVDFEDEEKVTPAGAIYETSFLLDHEAESGSSALLTRLSSDRPATLAGLPAGDPLLIFTGEFAGEDNQTYYRQLAELGGRYWNRQRGYRDSLSVRQFYGIFEEVGEHMQGVRFAVYRNPDPNGMGVYSVVFIADADDPAALVEELRQMMRLARAEEVDVDDPSGAVTDEEIADLVRNLGDRLFRVRREATNRLLVIGTRATPLLEAALDDESLELRTRAKVILDHFATLQTDEARRFFGSDLLEQLDPDYRYIVAGETLSDGTPVDWISVTVPEESQPHVQRLEAWLGTDWDRWRLVQTGDHVAVYIGSRPEMLEETLSCLRESAEPQLHVAGWSEEEPHQFVLHLDAYEFVPAARWQPSQLEPGVEPGLTSFGLDFAADAVRIDAYSPVTQVRRLGSMFF